MDKDELQSVLESFIDFFELMQDESKVTVEVQTNYQVLNRLWTAKEQVTKARQILAEVKRNDNLLFS